MSDPMLLGRLRLAAKLRCNEFKGLMTEAAARIAELEAERDRLKADADLFVFLHALAIEHCYMPDPGESAYDLLQRAIMTGSPARIAELEAEREREAREKIAAWMITHSFATGHGDTLDDLLHELEWQIEEIRSKVTP